MISSHNSYSGSPSVSKAAENPVLSLLTLALEPPVFSLLIKPSKNAENADSISLSLRVSMLLYPHIIRAELTMASNWRSEQSDNGWHLAESGQREPAALCTSFKLTRCLTRIFSEKIREGGKRSHVPADSSTKYVVHGSADLQLFSAEQEQRKPLERNPVPFNGSRFCNQCKNITQSLLIITGLLMCSTSATTAAQITQHLLSCFFFLLVCNKNKQLNKLNMQLGLMPKWSTCQFDSF